MMIELLYGDTITASISLEEQLIRDKKKFLYSILNSDIENKEQLLILLDEELAKFHSIYLKLLVILKYKLSHDKESYHLIIEKCRMLLSSYNKHSIVTIPENETLELYLLLLEKFTDQVILPSFDDCLEIVNEPKDLVICIAKTIRNLFEFAFITLISLERAKKDGSIYYSDYLYLCKELRGFDLQKEIEEITGVKINTVKFLHLLSSVFSRKVMKKVNEDG